MLGTTPSIVFGLLVATPAPYVERHIHQVTTAMAALGDIEERHHQAGGRNVCVVTSRPRGPRRKRKALARVLFR